VTWVVLEADPRPERVLYTDYINRAGLMTTRGSRCGIIQLAHLPRAASGEVDRAKLTAALEGIAGGDD
jgi:hypothetical protein